MRGGAGGGGDGGENTGGGGGTGGLITTGSGGTGYPGYGGSGGSGIVIITYTEVTGGTITISNLRYTHGTTTNPRFPGGGSLDKSIYFRRGSGSLIISHNITGIYVVGGGAGGSNSSTSSTLGGDGGGVGGPTMCTGASAAGDVEGRQKGSERSAAAEVSAAVAQVL